MHDLLKKLHRDHVNLGRVLNLLVSQLNEFYEGRESDFDLKIELLEYIESYAELLHQPTEDLIFDLARERVGKKRPLLEKTAQQHASLIGLTRKFRQSLEGIMQGAIQARDEIEIEGREFIALQRQHILTEESELFPVLDACIDDDEWDQIEQKMPKLDDPVFGKPDSNRFRTLVQYLSEASD